MVAPPSSLPSTPSNLDPSTALGEKSQSSTTSVSLRASAPDPDSQPRCISPSSCLPPCQPVMEATKALAQRLRIRSKPSEPSPRPKINKRFSLSLIPAEEPKSPKPARPASRISNRLSRLFKPEDVEAVLVEAQKKPNGDIPAPVAIADPPAATAASAAPLTHDLVSSPVATETPLTPSPGSGVSPTSTVPAPKQATGRIDPDKALVETPTSDYFSLDSGDAAEDATVGKITFAIPSKDVEPGTERASLPETENPGSSTTPSTVVSPRDSVDEKLSSTLDDRRSSIVSFVSQRSSAGSIARRWSAGLSSQNRPLKELPPRELIPTLSPT